MMGYWVIGEPQMLIVLDSPGFCNVECTDGSTVETDRREPNDQRRVEQRFGQINVAEFCAILRDE